jgi:hypothetical protein
MRRAVQVPSAQRAACLRLRMFSWSGSPVNVEGKARKQADPEMERVPFLLPEDANPTVSELDFNARFQKVPPV